MHFEEGAKLGVLVYTTLGVSPNARVSSTKNENGVIIDDLETGTRYVIVDSDLANARRETFEVPQYVKDIIALSDAALADQFRRSLGSLNLQVLSALRSECSFRGLDPLQ